MEIKDFETWKSWIVSPLKTYNEAVTCRFPLAATTTLGCRPYLRPVDAHPISLAYTPKIWAQIAKHQESQISIPLYHPGFPNPRKLFDLPSFLGGFVFDYLWSSWHMLIHCTLDNMFPWSNCKIDVFRCILVLPSIPHKKSWVSHRRTLRLI